MKKLRAQKITLQNICLKFLPVTSVMVIDFPPSLSVYLNKQKFENSKVTC